MAKQQQRVSPPDDAVQTAYQVHTLAQLLYARLVAATFPPVLQ